jgi:hypothetical protein
MHHLATAFREARRLAEAARLWELVATRAKASLGPEHTQTIAAKTGLAAAWFDLGRTAESIRLFEEALQLSKSKFGIDHPDTLQIMFNLAAVYREVGRSVEAVALVESVAERRRCVLGPNHPQTLETAEKLATEYRRVGRLAEAAATLEDVVGRRKADDGPVRAELVQSLHRLGLIYRDQGRISDLLHLLEEIQKLGEAGRFVGDPGVRQAADYLPLLRKALDAERRFRQTEADRGPDHRDALAARLDWGVALRDALFLREADEQIAYVLAARRRILGADHYDVFEAWHHLAWVRGRQHRIAEAAVEYRALLSQSLAKGEPRAKQYALDYLQLCKNTGECDAEAVAIARRLAGAENALLADALFCAGANLVKQRRFAQAEPLLAEALALRQKSNPNDGSTIQARSALAQAKLGLGKFEETEPLLLSAYEAYTVRGDATGNGPKPEYSVALQLSEMYRAWGKVELAKEWLAKTQPKSAGAPAKTPARIVQKKNRVSGT